MEDSESGTEQSSNDFARREPTPLIISNVMFSPTSFLCFECYFKTVLFNHFKVEQKAIKNNPMFICINKTLISVFPKASISSNHCISVSFLLVN